MKKSYTQIAAGIEALEKERADLDSLVQHIKDAIAAHSLTPADLGFEGSAEPAAATLAAATKKTARVSKRKGKGKGKKKAAVFKYADDAGNGWVGRGPRPQWLRDALAKGKTLEDFAV